MVINGIDVNSINTEKLKKQLEKYGDSQEDFDKDTYYGIEQFLHHLGYNDLEIRYSKETMPSDDVLMYDMYNDEFYNLKDGYEVRLYRWMKGTNLEVIYDEVSIETSLIVSEESVCLDVWDGRNYSTGSQFEHEKVYKIFEVDGIKVEDMYLVEHWSQWQGTHTEGIIMSRNDLNNHLKSLDYDVIKYMNKIDNTFTDSKW
ncbi:hypothetical protein [Pseudoneobacillus sp. C159]